jgi:CHASE1-domain containing sensor protein/two-component sensor histidine kinase
MADESYEGDRCAAARSARMEPRADLPMKRYLPATTFAVVAAVGVAGAAIQYISNHHAERLHFEAVAGDAVNRIEARLARHLTLLDATSAFFEARDGTVTPERFATFAGQLDLNTRHAGIAGLGFAPLVEGSARGEVSRAFRERYGGGVRIRPVGTGLRHSAPIAVIAITDEAPPDVIGLDMYADPVRREGMEAAAEARAPRSTGVTRLATDGETASHAFIVFEPLYEGGFGVRPRGDGSGTPTGYAFAAFRVADFLSAAVTIPPFLPINLEVYEGGVEPDNSIFEYGSPAAPALAEDFAVTRPVDVAGRAWTLVIRPTAAYPLSSSNALSLLLGAVSLLFAAALAASLRAQDRAHAAAEELAETMEHNLFEKDLMLQEMKHRIKNSIARILAMARQTAARAESVEAFSETFTARLQAMAAAQDMLTRSRYGRADLRELLLQELGQVFGEADERITLTGPAVSLDEAVTQALGLTFHELATNALKHGGEDAPRTIAVTWSLRRTGGEQALALRWRETGAAAAPPSRTGFGTRLIDANIRAELRGSITRDFGPDGLTIAIEVPLTGGQPRRPLGRRTGAPERTPAGKPAAATDMRPAG